MAVIENNQLQPPSTTQPRSPSRAIGDLLERVPASWWIVGVVLLFMPVVANSFVLFQIFGWAFILGMVALSLMFLGGYGGMVSLAQMSIAGLAGYMVAILGTSGVTTISLSWPWWLTVPVAIIIASLFATLIGALAVRTEGIYTIMITLAIAAAFFYFTRQNYTLFNGYTGFANVVPPELFGVNWRSPIPFYYLSLVVRRSPISSSSTFRARRSALRCRACVTTRAAWPRSASTSSPTASLPTLLRLSSLRWRASFWCGRTR